MFSIKARRAKSIETRVSRGAALLDKARPGWHRNINLTRLDISNGRHCALGQTYGLYGWGRDQLGLHGGMDTARHGFQIDLSALPPFGTRAAYDRLTEEWKRQIETRLDAERAAWAKDRKIMGHRSVRRSLTRR